MVKVFLEHIATSIPVKVETESLETLNDTMRLEGYLESDEIVDDQYFVDEVVECRQ